MGRKLVIFADGTGNAFTTQESNVWRLYEALDRSSSQQLARYMKGVGTSGFRPFAILDGATGIGVPSNVRELYRFLCWNWTPNDEIYLFGFSRGAFTVRTLAALISSQGLVTSEVDGIQVSGAIMRHNAKGAWRAYRAELAPRSETWPTVWLTRYLRDGFVFMRDKLSRRPSYRAVQALNRRKVRISFLGVFDTVEAYGVPFAELTFVINRAIWPMSFRNDKLPKIAGVARHALALDDERLTFHPKHFDPDPSGERDVKEVWFAGVHSDVGGGYLDAALSYLPLVWMAQEATKTFTGPDGAVRASGLTFRENAIQSYEAMAFPHSPIHDSRSGLGIMYRYRPRMLPASAVLHESVAVKMALGTKDYAPTVLRSSAEILQTDDKLVDVTEWIPVGSEIVPPIALEREYLERMRDLVWWRHRAYVTLVVAAAGLAASPLVLHGPAAEPSNWPGAAKHLASLIPGWTLPWISVAGNYPAIIATLLFAAAVMYKVNGNLRDSIGENAQLAWSAHRRARHGPAAQTETGPLLRLARLIRRTDEWGHFITQLWARRRGYRKSHPG